MAARLGGQQIAALLETLPGIASVLRSPVADAIVGLSRAGAGLGEFRLSDAKELVEYAVRRSLLGQDEAGELMAELKEAASRRGKKRAITKKKASRSAKKKAKSTTAKAVVAKSVKKTAVKKTTKKAGKPTR